MCDFVTYRHTVSGSVKILTMSLAYLSLTLLVLTCWGLDHCGCLLVSLSEEDNVVSPGHHNCDGPISIPYEIFNHNTLYVSHINRSKRGQI